MLPSVAGLLFSALALPLQAGYVTVLNVTAGTSGSCPSPLNLTTDPSNDSVCVRGGFPASSLTLNASAAMESHAYLKGLRVFTQIRGSAVLYQKGTDDAFQTGLRNSSLDSDNYVDGISLTLGSPRIHMYTIALGNSYDIDLATSGMCPCASQTRTAACGAAATAAPSFIGDDWVCDSGNYGMMGTSWEARSMTFSFSRTVSQTHDSLELRVMADQPVSNEDIGIQSFLLEVLESEDNDPPVVTMSGNVIEYIEVGDPFFDPGVVCIDSMDGTVSATRSWQPSNLSSMSPMAFYLTYTCTDTRANSANVTRIVQVRDTEAPEINVWPGLESCTAEQDEYAERGAVCRDLHDGVYDAVVAGSVDPHTPGQYLMNYTCADSSLNVAKGTTTVVVVKATGADIVQLRQVMLQTSTNGSYSATGVRGHLTNVNPSSDLVLEFSVPLAPVTESCRYLTVKEGVGSRASVVRQFEALALSAGAVSGTRVVVREQHRMVKAYDNIWPLCQDFGTCFTDMDLVVAKELCLSLVKCTGFSFTASAIDRGIGSGCLKSCTDEGVNGFGNASHSFGPHGFWRKEAAASSVLASSLKDLTTYTVAIDEFFALSASNSSQGSSRQAFTFATGDYTPPVVVATLPADREMAWPLSASITLTLDEPIAGAASRYIVVTRVADAVQERIPCDGSGSSSGTSLVVNSKRVVISDLSAWQGWRACRDYRISIDDACLTDLSVNKNPSVNLTVVEFFTECAMSVTPQNGAVGISVQQPLEITFDDDMLASTGRIYVALEGQALVTLNVQDYPNIYVQGVKLVVDLACITRTCQLMRGPNTTDTGWCMGHMVQECKGKLITVSVGFDAVRLANASWLSSSLLGVGGHVPVQLGNASYGFILAEADLTPPLMLSVLVSAVSEAMVNVEVRLDEAGAVYCAAFGDPIDDVVGGSCTSVTLVNDSSAGFCSAVLRDDCASCQPPSFGCTSSATMWVDDGCAGIFRLNGHLLQCDGRMNDPSYLDGTLYDGAWASVLSVGRRHSCGILKSKTNRLLICWGKSDSISPTGLPPTGTFAVVAVGEYHSCAIREVTGLVVCFGQNLYGELLGPSSLTVAFKSVTSGYAFSCGIRSDNLQAMCWGLNDAGQSSPPAGVAFLAISAGNRHVCGVRQTDHYVQCWGQNTYNQSSPPADVAFLARSPGGSPLPQGSISAGYYHTCAVRESDGQVVCWGDATNGKTAAPSFSHGYVQVAAGSDHTCAVRKIQRGYMKETDFDNTVICWGLNNYGQATPLDGIKVSAITAGEDYTCAIDLGNGTSRCWGKNDWGQGTVPTAQVFGVPDVYGTTFCSLQLSEIATVDAIRTAAHTGLQGAWAEVVYNSERNQWQMSLSLSGLSVGREYNVYCMAEDAEWPTPNVVSTSAIQATRNVITPRDMTPPALQILNARASGPGAVTLTVQLSEPGRVLCGVVHDQLPPPLSKQLADQGVAVDTDASLVATVVIQGLPPDTELDAYCTARDRAGQHPDALGVHNWMEQSAVVQSKFDTHTVFDATPPILLTTSPVHLRYADCEPDGAAAGCRATVRLTFSEDVFRGTGNLTLVCLENLPDCTHIVVPFSPEVFVGGTTFVQNKEVFLHFTTPLVDASMYKVRVPANVITDVTGNSFVMDVQCEPGFDPSWQAHLGVACPPVYAFKTAS